MIAWMFTLPLVMDKQLDFWSAMELSRKVVTKHWFKFLGFGIVLALLIFAGALALGFGVFVALPLVCAATIYAYEDILGGVKPEAKPATGPMGTVVMPPTKPAPTRAADTGWTPATKIGLAAVGLVICAMLAWGVARRVDLRHHLRFDNPIAHPGTTISWTPGDVPAPAAPAPPTVSAEPGEAAAPAVFGTVTEQTLTNLSAIQIESGRIEPLPESFGQMKPGPETDSAIASWMENTNVDFSFITADSGFYGMTRDMVTLKRDVWDAATPESLRSLLLDTGHDTAARFGNASALNPFGERPANSPKDFTYGFKTRAGVIGLLQVTAFTDQPRGVTIRYKLFQPATNKEMAAAGTDQNLREKLSERLDAASSINDPNEKEPPLAAIATDAAKAGEVEIVKKALAQMSENRNETTRQAALLLAKRGLRKQAIEIAKGINDNDSRNQTLSELAQ